MLNLSGFIVSSPSLYLSPSHKATPPRACCNSPHLRCRDRTRSATLGERGDFAREIYHFIGLDGRQGRVVFKTCRGNSPEGMQDRRHSNGASATRVDGAISLKE